MRPRTFALNGPPPEGELVELPGEQSRHARLVLRLKPGQALRLLSADGFSAPAVLAESARPSSKVTVRLTGPWELAAPENSAPVHLAVALVKPARFELVVQKAVELGAASLIPLQTGRVRPLGLFRTDRLRKIAAEAQKQCLRPWPLLLEEPHNWADFLARLAGQAALKIIMAPETAQPWPAPEPERPLYLAVGPEGGFSPLELGQAREAGFRPVGLGPYILRTETAALSALAIWGHLRGWLR